MDEVALPSKPAFFVIGKLGVSFYFQFG